MTTITEYVECGHHTQLCQNSPEKKQTFALLGEGVREESWNVLGYIRNT